MTKRKTDRKAPLADLPPERRREIAREAVRTRWSRELDRRLKRLIERSERR